MEIKKHGITLRGCLLIWIGISIVLVKDTKEEDSTTADPTQTDTAAVNIMETTAETPIQTPANTANDVQSMPYTENPDLMLNSSMGPGNNHENPLMPPSNSCHLFYCIGEGCYKNQSAILDSSNITCSTYCEMYRHNSSSYEARCNQHCMHHICNSTQQDNCALHCCNQSQCFNSEDINGGNMTMDNKTAMPPIISTTTTTTTTASTTTTIQYSDKKCRSFTCTGADCFKNQAGAATKQCQVGIVHCELQKKVTNGDVSYEAGCSNTCATSTKSCASITNANCFQECCNATSTACCMKLDGQVHFNTAAGIHKCSILRMFTYAFIVIFLSHYFSSAHL